MASCPARTRAGWRATVSAILSVFGEELGGGDDAILRYLYRTTNATLATGELAAVVRDQARTVERHAITCCSRTRRASGMSSKSPVDYLQPPCDRTETPLALASQALV